MKLIKIYCVLWLLMCLVWQPVWSADKYILPVIPFLIIFLARGLVGKTQLPESAPSRMGRHGRDVYGRLAILLALLLCNFVHIGVLAVKNVSTNIVFIKGNKYAGYSEQQKRFYMEIERLADSLPKGTVIISRKPEIVYYLTGLKGRYPWGEQP